MPKEIYSLEDKKVWVAGHRGLVGSALMRRLSHENCSILTAGREDADLIRQDEAEAWIAEHRPEVIFLAAAKVGGILANDTYPADFIYENLMIAANVIEAARRYDVEKVIYLGSSCVYPKFAAQPMSEDALLTGPLEPTNEWYAIAKIAGIKMAQAYRRQHGCDFISAQPTNLYGPGDNFDLDGSHVVPALLRKAHEAKQARSDEMVVWGSGEPRREFLFVDDLADALVFLAQHYSGEATVNVGTGEEVTIRELATMVCSVVGFEGELLFDTTKPDGTPRKLLDVSRLHAMGWRHKTTLRQGLEQAYQWYTSHQDDARGVA